MPLGGCPGRVTINPGELLGIVLRAQNHVRRAMLPGNFDVEGLRMAFNDLHHVANLLNFIEETYHEPAQLVQE